MPHFICLVFLFFICLVFYVLSTKSSLNSPMLYKNPYTRFIYLGQFLNFTLKNWFLGLSNLSIHHLGDFLFLLCILKTLFLELHFSFFIYFFILAKSIFQYFLRKGSEWEMQFLRSLWKVFFLLLCLIDNWTGYKTLD